jgi:hypothetical protein
MGGISISAPLSSGILMGYHALRNGGRDHGVVIPGRHPLQGSRPTPRSARSPGRESCPVDARLYLVTVFVQPHRRLRLR